MDQFQQGLAIFGAQVCSNGTVTDSQLTADLEHKKRSEKGIKLNAIRQRCTSNIPLSPESLARGYLWYLLGSTIFPDKSGDSVPLGYLDLLGDLNEGVKNMAWGAGVLANLYLELGKASRAGGRSISGCLTLLESWIYEYFPEFTRVKNPYWNAQTHPRACRWSENHTRVSKDSALIGYRQQLDQLDARNVKWTPFGAPKDLPHASYYHGCIRFMGNYEAYMPDRVSRQFGRVQKIPQGLIEVSKGTRLAFYPRSYKKVYGNTDHAWRNMLQHVYAPDELGGRASQAHKARPDYLPWYLARTHVKVYNPERGAVRASNTNEYVNYNQRLDTIREQAADMYEHASQDPQIPELYRQGLEDIGRVAGSGGYPGLQQHPMGNEWFGQPGGRWPEEQFNPHSQPHYGWPYTQPDQDNDNN